MSNRIIKAGNALTKNINDAVDSLDQGITLKNFEFLVEAHTRGMLNSKSSMTVFVPENEYYSESTEDFELIWNRHTAKGRIHVSGMEQQISTYANLTFGVYKEEDDDSIVHDRIAGVDFTFLNIKSTQFSKITFHGINGLLPDLRPTPASFDNLKVCFLGLETVDLTFVLESLSTTTDRNLTLLITISDTVFKLLTPPHHTPWIGTDTHTQFIIPNVATPQKAILWFSIFDNVANLRLVTSALAWEICIMPNVHSVHNSIITDIHPRTGKVDDVVFICGANFSSQTVRVFFGETIANVYSISDSLIKCFVPRQDDEDSNVDITVFNANVYVTYHQFIYIP